MAKGNPSNSKFDIDLALDGGDVYKAMDITEDSSFSIDIVSLDLLPEHVRSRIRKEGIVL